MTQAIIFTGLQASGKTSYFMREYFDTHVRLNLDMLGASRSKEAKLLDACIVSKIPCVVDNTNLTQEHRGAYLQKFTDAGYEILSIYFDSSLGDCIARNESRKDKPPIPRVALLTGSKKLEVPIYEEGFDQITIVTLSSTNDSYRIKNI